MAGFTPVAGQLNYVQPDWVGGLQAQRRNALADQQLSMDQQGMDLRRNAFALDQQRFQGEQQQQQSQQRQQAIQQIGSLAQRIAAEPPETQRQVTASILQNQAYLPLFKAAGIDPSQLDVNSPDFVQHLKTWASLAPERAPTIVPKGSTVLDANTHQPLYKSGPEEITPYQTAQLGIERQRLAAEAARGNKPQLVTVENPDGTKTQKWVQPGQTEGPALGPPSQKPLGEADKKNAVLFESMLNAEKQIQALTAQKGGATDTSSKWNAVLGGVPSWVPGGGMAKVAQTDEYRKYESAGLRWAANLLYLKSGATANPDEIRSTWKQFFPQPGDGPDVKAQKEQARQQEIESTRKYMVPNAAPLNPASNASQRTDLADLQAPSGSSYTDASQWAKRADGSQKGNGWLGLLRRPDGGVSSEISIGVNLGGKEQEIPLIVPTLTRAEVQGLLAKDPKDPNFMSQIPATIKQKAVAFARDRIAQGQSPFASAGQGQGGKVVNFSDLPQ